MRIEFHSCVKRYADPSGDVDALRGIDLKIEDGELFVFLGPSGCGKSTLLNLTAGLERLSLGEIRFDGELVDSPERNIFVTPRERNVAMVFQSYALYPHLNVSRNISFPLEVAKEPETTRRKAVAEVAALLSIVDLLERKPGELSGGQRQRVAMARALVRRPRVFLLDEPLSNLDVQLRTETRAELKQLQRNLNITTLYVTHDQTEAMTLGDRIALLKAGRLVQVGTPRQMYENPRTPFAASFIGSPPMNLFSADVKGLGEKAVIASGGTHLTVEKGRVPAEQGRFVIGIRPEDIRVQGDASGDVLEGVIKVIEPLGREDLLHVTTPFGDLQALHSGERFEAGRKVWMSFESDKVHCFEAGDASAA